MHSEYVAASRNFLALWSAASPVPGEVLLDHAACVAMMPNMQGYPTVVYEDAAGQRHVLFNPQNLAAVTAWRDGIDNPPKSTVMSRYVFSQRFHSDEMLAILAAQSTDTAVALFLKLLDYAEQVDLTDTNLTSAFAHMVSAGLLTQDRATAILTP